MRDNIRHVRPKVHKAFPDAIAPGFAVVSGPGGISFSGKAMHIPLDETPYSRMVRLHEMGHLTYTPKKDPDKQCAKYGIPMDLLQVCEDARINTLMEKAHRLPMRNLGETEDLTPFRDGLKKLVDAGQHETALRQAVEFRVGMQFRNELQAARILRELDLEDALDIANAGLQHLKYKRSKSGLGFPKTVKAARAIMDALESRDILRDSPSDLGDTAKMCSPGGSTVRGGMAPWGRMEIEVPKSLSTRHHAGRLTPKYRPADDGRRLRNVSRALTDGRIFARKIKQEGGSLLIDGSGSMSMSPEDVAEILKMAPLAWVAIYGAQYDSGKVKILARDGKCVAPADMRSPGACNVIDGPALELLAKQSTPRIWICDGHVTGVGDRMTHGNILEAAKICSAANIKRIGTVESAITYMRTLSRPR